MPVHHSTELSPYSTEQLFALVADVQRYPEFLPWCRAARILSHQQNEMLAELVISFAHLTESYTSRVLLYPPANAQSDGRIEVTMVKGPFSYLTNRWHFVPIAKGDLMLPKGDPAMPDGGTKIELELDFKFKSRLLDSLIGGIFERASLKMATAFKERAAALYGNATAS